MSSSQFFFHQHHISCLLNDHLLILQHILLFLTQQTCLIFLHAKSKCISLDYIKEEYVVTRFPQMLMYLIQTMNTRTIICLVQRFCVSLSILQQLKNFFFIVFTNVTNIHPTSIHSYVRNKVHHSQSCNFHMVSPYSFKKTCSIIC